MDIRRLTPDSAAIWCEFRLNALASDPPAFSTRLAQAQTRGLEYFAAQLEAGAYFAAFEGEVLGGVMGHHVQSPGSANHRGEIVAVFVKPEFRGTGMAGALLETVIAHSASLGLRQVELGARGDDPRAVRFYEKHGFEEMGCVPDAYYHDGVYYDGLLMLRRLQA